VSFVFLESLDLESFFLLASRVLLVRSTRNARTLAQFLSHLVSSPSQSRKTGDSDGEEKLIIKPASV
jgi:hypothetical protein